MSAVKREYYKLLDRDTYYQSECDKRDQQWWHQQELERMKNGLKTTKPNMTNNTQEKVA